MNFSDSVTTLKGVGAKKAEALGRLHIETIGELLHFFPRGYQDRRSVAKIAEAKPGMQTLFRAAVVRVIDNRFVRGRKRLLKVVIDDGSGRAELLFFNAAWLAKTFTVGKEYYFYGRVTQGSHAIQIAHPEFSAVGEGEQRRILPVYPLTEGVTQNEMRKWQWEAQQAADTAADFLPEDLVRRNALCSYAYALHHIHFPQDEIRYKQAKFRLVFDEMLCLQTGLLAVRAGDANRTGGIAFDRRVRTQAFTESFPYPLTGAQARVAGEILSDMESSRTMNRLVQGDVGSGKTAVAEIAMYKAAKCGYQAVLMAPTEILARQHYEGIRAHFEQFGVSVGFLSGGVGRAERAALLERLASGELSVLIGTHAVLQPDVRFHKLGLVITDEQHRFGVNQRTVLGEKGESPDRLVMTATPIPRTLAVILFGDLDISVIDELPPGRKPIVTRAVSEAKRREAYDFVKKQIEQGHQAYVVTPLIEDSEAISVRSAESVYEELRARFPDVRTALLHGAMKQKEKDDVMKRFAAGELDLLVSTVVIEVGVNVPNATVMVIENAERFGLAQMHQLRGRVGRGADKSYCILIGESSSEVARERAEIMTRTGDGFVIAEKDLELRGPGEFFGTRQHGLPDLHIADLVKHIDLLEIVKKEAELILKEDPFLASEKYAGLKKEILSMFGGSLVLRL